MRLVSAAEGHRLWAPTYDAAPNPLLALEHRLLADLLNGAGALHGKRVIDVACGTGRWANYVQARGARAIGIDLCREMIEHCQAPAILAEATRLPLAGESSDITICAFALGYMDSPLAELTRITKRGGSIFVSDIHPEALERGWTRSFRSGAEVYEIEHRRYSLPDLLRASGLQLGNFLQPHFGPPEREIFRRASKESSFEKASDIPAIFIAHWIRQ